MRSVENYFGDKTENLNRVLAAYGKSSKDLNQDVGIIKSWLKTQPHLPEIPRDNLIINMLIKSKFSIEKTKKSLDMYYSLRTLIPEIYENKNPKLPNMQYLMNTELWFPLPTLTDDGYRVNMCKMTVEPEKMNFLDLMALRFNMGEVFYLEDFVVGSIYIEDLSNVKMGHVLKMTPAVVKKVAIVFEKSYNVRMKAFHLVNAPPYFETVFTLLKQVLSPKLAQRLHVHKSIDSLADYISPKILPIEYGGTEYTVDELQDFWKKKFSQSQYRFDELEKLKTDERKRPKPLNNDEVLGYYGNFKKLDVD